MVEYIYPVYTVQYTCKFGIPDTGQVWWSIYPVYSIPAGLVSLTQVWYGGVSILWFYTVLVGRGPIHTLGVRKGDQVGVPK